MSEPVKTLLLRSLEEKLRGIEEVKTVVRWDDIPVDLSGYETPVLFFWEEEEKEPHNRLTLGRLDLWFQVFEPLRPDQDGDYVRFCELAEVIAAKIDNLMSGEWPDLRAAGLIQVIPGRVVKTKHNPEWGVLFMIYQVIYAHRSGDAFSLNR